MKNHVQNRQGHAAARGDRIAVMHRDHARALERRVASRARAQAQTSEDACSFAWMQLLTHTAVDLDCTHDVLRWLTLTATREAWRLEARCGRELLVDDDALEHRLNARSERGAGEQAARRARLDLIAQIPERPRRFLWRLALGHSYREIAMLERASATTTNKQIARAKRALRALDAA